MSRFYRFRLPPWARNCLLVIEQALLPLVIFQTIRTLLLPTTFDVILLALFVLLFIAFYLHWI